MALPYALTQGVAEIPGFDLEGSDLVISFDQRGLMGGLGLQGTKFTRMEK